ncbi:MAG: DeoR/GlpR family DNA-binding transcription regulator [Eubacteriales bacterium]|nr:DeoR/GlpR family DNA-binding transcription regulator [Eubacteriales bacterium]
MLTVERMGEISRLLHQNGLVKVDELSRRFGVSEMTVRRDLDRMEEDGCLVRCHGGAVLPAEQPGDETADRHSAEHMDAKEKIALYCLEHYVEENSVIYLDAGSTVLELARMMAGMKNVTVVTNDVMIAGELVNSDVNVFMLGGNIQRGLGCIHGHMAETQLENYRMDMAFVGGLCVDDSFDLYDSTESRAYFRKKLMSCASRTYMMLDHSKFHRQSLFKINNLADYCAVISDGSLLGEEQEAALAAGIEWVSV